MINILDLMKSQKIIIILKFYVKNLNIYIMYKIQKKKKKNFKFEFLKILKLIINKNN